VGFEPSVVMAELELHRAVEQQWARVDDLISRISELPDVPHHAELIRRLNDLSRTDVRECLRSIGQALAELAADRARSAEDRMSPFQLTAAAVVRWRSA
jgi:hypothetical protein